MKADDLARQFIREGLAPNHGAVVDFLRDFEIHDDDFADEVYYAAIDLHENTK